MGGTFFFECLLSLDTLSWLLDDNDLRSICFCSILICFNFVYFFDRLKLIILLFCFVFVASYEVHLCFQLAVKYDTYIDDLKPIQGKGLQCHPSPNKKRTAQSFHPNLHIPHQDHIELNQIQFYSIVNG